MYSLMNLKKIEAVSLFLAVLIMWSCGGKKEAPAIQQKGGDIASIDGFVVKAEPLSNILTVPGTLEPGETVELRPEVQGKVTGINFQEGTTVKQGQLLVKLYDADLQAELKGIKLQYDLASRNEERAKKLLDIEGLSQQEYDVVKNAVDALSASMELVQAKIARTEIRAPFNGKVGLRKVSLGAMVGPTDVVATLVQDNPLKLDFTLQEKYVYALNGKEKVTFKVDGVDGEFPGRIAAKEPLINAATRALSVRAVCDNPGGKLLPGAFASVSVLFDKIPDALLVPNQAIIPEARAKKVVVSRNGQAEFVEVITGTRDADKVHIVSGLNVGDTIAVTGLLRVRPGMKLAFKNLNNTQTAE